MPTGAVSVWWVNQGKTFVEERDGGFLWAPIKGRDGRSQYHWETMRDVRKGDIILHYAGSQVRATSRVLAEAVEAPQPETFNRWERDGLLVKSQYVELSSPVALQSIAHLPALNGIVQGPLNRSSTVNLGYLFRFSLQALKAVVDASQCEWPEFVHDALGTLPADSPPPRPLRSEPICDLAQITNAFANELRSSGLIFGGRHDAFVRAFVTSLATKRLVILTGLSGSGKSQIALQMGRWLGADRHLVVPVRPDWSGPEALLGFEDALRGSGEQRVWHTPLPLGFMLHAVRDPAHPYLLVLDEMNLAHVERYFADVLSGMESGEGCLPNLIEEDGVWRISDVSSERLPFPNNLFVVGTVNVDETTYMFSPKVLDRANTIEFRVSADELVEHARRPESVDPGDERLATGLLSLAADDAWQLQNPHPQQAWIAARLRDLHVILAPGGFEFGHRVFYEALRFASLLAAAGEPDPFSALDLQVMQKVLPRLHGGRRRLEPVLLAIGGFCVEPVPGAGPQWSDLHGLCEHDGGTAKLPIAFAKLQRMARKLIDDQFTSFAE